MSMKGNTTTDLLLGAVAGAVATLAMSPVTSALYRREGKLTRWRENWARGGSDTNVIAARKAASLIGTELSGAQASVAGQALHFGIGTSSGALYGVARRHLPATAPVRGLLFGAALWLIGDEVGNPALGVTPGPGAFPWQTHARGLAAHLVFGLVAEGVLTVADTFRDRRSDDAGTVASSAKPFAGAAI